MALLDAYVDIDFYEARASGGNTLADATALGEELTSSSRLLDRELGVHDGAFNSHSATYTFDATGGSRLWLRDRAGRAYFLQSVQADGIGIDSELDGSYDGYQLDFNDAWVRGLPENAAALSQPFTSIEILGHITTANPTIWPDLRAGVQINGTWGWAAVPGLIKEIVVSMTRDLRDHHGAGAASRYQEIDQAMPLSSQTWRLIKSAKQQYSRRLPAVA